MGTSPAFTRTKKMLNRKRKDARESGFLAVDGLLFSTGGAADVNGVCSRIFTFEKTKKNK
jgi:hypothetical protein